MIFTTPDGKFNVLSLFDGMSCLQITLKELGVIPTNYFASEIKKSGIDFSLRNFPDTKHLGDVTKWRSWNLPRIDLVAFGSPCQDFSNLNRNGLKDKGLAGKESGLFFVAFEILNALKKINPDILFMAENVRGSDILSEYLRVRPVEVNNLEFACSSRPRLFFTNIGAKKKYDVLGNVYYEQCIPNSVGNANITLKLDNPSLSEKGLWIGEEAAVKFLSHPLTTGNILRDGVPSQTGCMSRGRSLNKFGFSWVYQHGRYRYHTEGELRQMHSIPDWVVFPNKTLGVVQDLIGDGWAVGSAKHILQYLPFVERGQVQNQIQDLMV